MVPGQIYAAMILGFVDVLVADNARNLLAAMYDRYATHVIRTLVRVLAGSAHRSSKEEGGGKGGGGGGKGGGGGGKGGGGGGAAFDANSAEAPRTPVPPSFERALVRIGEALTALDGPIGADGRISAVR